MEEIEKPFAIYALPRSRGTAILQASKKINQINEPFNDTVLKSLNYSHISDDHWDRIEKNMSDKNSATKFLSRHIDMSKKAQIWFNKIQQKQTFSIFVVYRDLEEICWSHALVKHFGWRKSENINNFEDVYVNEKNFVGIEYHINTFLKYFPKIGSVINWESLPEKFFDKRNVIIEEQFSNEKIKHIKNIDFCREQIYNIVKNYTPIINEKLSTLQWMK